MDFSRLTKLGKAAGVALGVVALVVNASGITPEAWRGPGSDRHRCGCAAPLAVLAIYATRGGAGSHVCSVRATAPERD
jgi:hypothetical protein